MLSVLSRANQWDAGEGLRLGSFDGLRLVNFFPVLRAFDGWQSLSGNLVQEFK